MPVLFGAQAIKQNQRSVSFSMTLGTTLSPLSNTKKDKIKFTLNWLEPYIAVKKYHNYNDAHIPFSRFADLKNFENRV